MLKLKVTHNGHIHIYKYIYNNAKCHLLTMSLYTYPGGRMGSVSQSAVRLPKFSFMYATVRVIGL